MNFDTITSDNFLIYATKTYDANQAADIEEFNTDLRRFSSIKRLLLRCVREPEKVNVRMLVNHIIIISNLFGVKASPKLLFFYCPAHTHPTLRSILDFLSIMPTKLTESELSEYIPCEKMINTLRSL